MKKSYLFILTLCASLLCGCGAPKPPLPSGQRIPVVQFSAQRAQENQVTRANSRVETETKVETNIRFGSEEDAGSGQ